MIEYRLYTVLVHHTQRTVYCRAKNIKYCIPISWEILGEMRFQISHLELVSRYSTSNDSVLLVPIRARLDCLTKPYDIIHLTKFWYLFLQFSSKFVKQNSLNNMIKCSLISTLNILFSKYVYFLQFWFTRFCQMHDIMFFCKAV